MKQQDALRGMAGLAGLGILALGVGFGLNLPWAAATWPWPDGALSHLFVGSILAAVAADFLWLGLTAEWGTLPAGAITGFVMAGGQTLYLFLLAGQPDRPGLLPYAGLFGAVALVSLGLLLWSRRFPVRDIRPLPQFLRLSYVIFVVVLVLAATALLLQAQIFPWTLKPESATMYGWIFLGDACYFCYALLHPRWHDARGQLLSFLAYDLFLIPAFLALFAERTTNVVSLIVYLLVLLYSGLLAVYYLFVDPRTRPWAVQARPLSGGEDR